MVEDLNRLPRETRDLPSTGIETVYVAGNRGTCGGVNMTLESVRQVMDTVDGREPVYTNYFPVHFPPAFKDFVERGLVNVQGDLSKVPDGAVLIVSAHGAPPPTFEEAGRRGLFVIDTTCALVAHEHELVKRAEAEGKHVLLIAEPNHPETIGVMGQVRPENITLIDPAKGIEDGMELPQTGVLYSKTTLSPREINPIKDELASTRPGIDSSRSTICYATHNRQLAMQQQLVSVADFLIVVGSELSHNARELRKIGEEANKPSVIVDGAENIDWNWFIGVKKVGVTSAASVPERFTQDVLQPFRDLSIPIEELAQIIPEQERMFRLPQSQLDALKQRYAS